MPPAMVRLNAIILNPQQSHPTSKLLRSRTASAPELVGPQPCEQGPAAHGLYEAEEAFIAQGRVERNGPLRIGCLERTRFGHQAHAPDPIDGDDALSAQLTD